MKEDLKFINPGGNYIYIPDNQSGALSVRKTGSSTDWMQFRTDTGNERVVVWKDLYVVGNLDISGTTTTIDATNLVVEDKNIELGASAAPSDTTSDGGGITLKATTDKTITYNNTSGFWETNIGLQVNDELHVHRASTTASNALLALHSDIGGTKTRKSTIRADGSAEFSGSVRVDHSGNAGSDQLVRLGNVNNSGTNSAHLFLANGYYVSPTAVDGTGAAAKIAADGTITDKLSVDIRRVKINNTTGAETVNTTNYSSGEAIVTVGGGSVTFEGGASGLAAGSMITVVNDHSSSCTLTQGSGMTLTFTDGTTGNKTLAGYGIATILYTTNSKAYISGTGVS